MQGNQEWYSLPFETDYEGERVAGIVSGFINAFTDIDNTDNLAQCVSSRLTKNIDAAVDSLSQRYNADIIDFETKMTDILLNLNESVESCQDLTKEHVLLIQEHVYEVEDDRVITNLADNTNHFELLYAKLRL